eukprot:jgi/Tetstr1/429491/TSEL_019398.t2
MNVLVGAGKFLAGQVLHKLKQSNANVEAAAELASDVKHIELLLEPLLAVGDADLPDEARQIVGAMNEHLKEVLRLLEYIDELKPEKDRNVRIPLVKKGIRVPGFKEAWNADDVDKQLRGLSSKLQKLITSMNVSLVSMLVSVNKKLDYVHKFMEEAHSAQLAEIQKSNQVPSQPMVSSSVPDQHSAEAMSWSGFTAEHLNRIAQLIDVCLNTDPDSAESLTNGNQAELNGRTPGTAAAGGYNPQTDERYDASDDVALLRKLSPQITDARARSMLPHQDAAGVWSFPAHTAVTALRVDNFAVKSAVRAIANAFQLRRNPDDSLCWSTHLRQLSITNSSNFGDYEACQLGIALEPQKHGGKWVFNGALSSITLKGTRIKCKGAKAIAEALAPRQNEDSAWTGNCTLEELHIDGAKHCDWIGDGGAIALADLLRPRQDDCGVYQPVLKSLSLQGNSIGDRGALALISALEGGTNGTANTELTTLRIAQNNKLTQKAEDELRTRRDTLNRTRRAQGHEDLTMRL